MLCDARRRRSTKFFVVFLPAFYVVCLHLNKIVRYSNNSEKFVRSTDKFHFFKSTHYISERGSTSHTRRLVKALQFYHSELLARCSFLICHMYQLVQKIESYVAAMRRQTQQYESIGLGKLQCLQVLVATVAMENQNNFVVVQPMELTKFFTHFTNKSLNM